MRDVKEVLQAQGPPSHERWTINPPNATVAIHPGPPVSNPNYGLPHYNVPHHNVPPTTPQFQPYYQQQQGIPHA